MPRFAALLVAGLAAFAFPVSLAMAGTEMAEFHPTTDLEQIQDGKFVVDKTHTKIIWSTTHFGFSTYYGAFADADMRLDFNPKEPIKSKIEVVVKMDSVDTNYAAMDERMKAEDYFNVVKYPTASFKSTNITLTGPLTGEVTGDLTMLGVTKPVVLDVKFNGGGTHPKFGMYILGFEATGVIKRSDFGFTTHLPVIGDNVALTISAEFNPVQ